MADDLPDRQVLKEILAWRAKYRTKEQSPFQNLRCGQIVPHPSNRGGEPISTSRTKDLAGVVLCDGYHLTEATVDSVVVEVDVDPSGKPRSTFSDHFKFSVELEPDHFIDPDAVISFAGLSHNSLNITARNVFNGMPGFACDPPATCLEQCTCNAKPIFGEKGEKLRYSMNKLKKADSDWYTAIVGGTEWEILSRDMDKEEPHAAHTIANALNRRNSAALCTTHLEMMRTLKGLCKPDPRTIEVPWDRVKAQMIKTFGTAARDDAYFAAYQLIVTAGGHVSESWDDFFPMGGLSRQRVSPADQDRNICYSRKIPASFS